MVSMPSKPSRRSASAARRPASEAPTTAIERSVVRGSALDGDGAGRADASRLFDLGAKLLARLLVEHVEIAVVAHLEDFGGGCHAQGVALAQVEVHVHAHG